MPSDRPNILLITSDQQHWNTLGSVNPRIQTPNIDRISSEGVRFDRAYCVNPVCSPSRSTIITGLYPAWHNCWTIGVKLPEDVPFVGDIFNAHGYDTTLIGKAHFQPLSSQPGSLSLECQPVMRDLGFWRGFHGPWYGFQHVEIARNHGDESHAGQHYGIWLEEQGLPDWKDYFQPWPRKVDGTGMYWRGGEKHWNLPEEQHYSTWTAERSIAAIERSVEADKPFFLWSSFQDPHPPYIVSEPWASMYDMEDMQPGRLEPGELDDMPPHFAKTQEEHPDFSMYHETYGPHGFHSHCMGEAELRESMAIYYGMISLMDDRIGRILDALDRMGIADNTLVVFSTDHGHFLGQHGLVAKGAFHYEDMVRIPMAARWLGHIPAGTVSTALQSQIDYCPTFLQAAGIEVPGYMQGLSQVDTWESGEPIRHDVVIENRHEPTLVHLRTYVNERYKLTLYRDHAYGELFDLQEDPHELHNRWADPDYAEVKSQLMFAFLQAELRREPTRMSRIAGA